MNRRVIRLECNQIICSLVTQHTDGKKDTKETEGSDKIFSGEVLQKNKIISESREIGPSIVVLNEIKEEMTGPN